MSFTVVWRPGARRQLAELWTSSPDRSQIADAADEVDRLLSQRPLAVGESRGGNHRILFVEPLGVLYDVVLDDSRVTVWSIWRRPGRRGQPAP